MRLGLSRRALLLFLWLLPKNLISKIGGWIASIRWPGPLLRLQLRSYAWTWGVNMEEIRDPLTSFRSMQEFFVRHLKGDARPIEPADDAFVSPCDGAWGASGTVEQGQLLHGGLDAFFETEAIRQRPLSGREVSGNGRSPETTSR